MVDLLPSEIKRWQNVESLARQHFDRAGLKEIRTPILELTELFARGIGEGTDVVGKEMYTFSDRGGRSCTLRPEGTASVARSVIENGLLNNGPQRLWYGGPMFRYERPQAGRQRQFHQLGVEFVGLESVLSEAELISIAWDFLKLVGLKGVKLELNSLGTNEDRSCFRKQLKVWLEKKYELLDKDSKQRINVNPLRILDSKNPNTQKLLEDAPSLNEFLSDKSRERFFYLQELLHQLSIPFEVNHKLVRGLDYYSHTAFEITSDQLGSQATVCGGGRYDGLISDLGGGNTPSIGWAIGMERLILLLGDSFTNKDVPCVYLIHRGSNTDGVALDVARKLRFAGIPIELDYSGSTFSKQFKRADRIGAQWALIIGEDELSKEIVMLKKLHSSSSDSLTTQFSFNLNEIDNLITFLKN